MDASTIGLIVTALCSVIAAIAAGINTVRKTEVETLRKLIEDLEDRIVALETDLSDERAAHRAERDAHQETREALRRCEERRPRPAIQGVR